MRIWFVAALVCSLAGCKKDAEKDSSPQVASGAAAQPGAAGVVDLYVDDKPVAHLALAQLEAWPRLDSIVPVEARRLGTWDDIVTKGTKTGQLHRPSDKYPQLVPALFVGDDKQPAFGMFDPVELAKHGKPEVREDDITELRIALQKGGGRGEHESGEGGGADPMTLKLAVKTPKGASTLDGPKLLEVAREPMPGDTEAKGWTLATVLKTAGIEKFQKIVLSDSAGVSLTLEKADFDANTSIPYVKLNRQGQLRLTVFKKQGETWQKAGDLRGLAAIEQLK